jgi:hypothetical protein
VLRSSQGDEYSGQVNLEAFIDPPPDYGGRKNTEEKEMKRDGD